MDWFYELFKPKLILREVELSIRKPVIFMCVNQVCKYDPHYTLKSAREHLYKCSVCFKKLELT